jgi:hypothetical protein
MSTHVHKPLSRAAAEALLTHKQLQLEMCECGAFRLNGCSRWVKPREVPPLEVELTIREAVCYLNLSKGLGISFCLNATPSVSTQRLFN